MGASGSGCLIGFIEISFSRKEPHMPFYIGIDIGNGEIKVAFTDPTGRPVVVRSEKGGKSWPSFVFLTNDGKVLVGDDAREQGLVYPEQVAHGWKMFLGDDTKKYFRKTKSASDVLSMALAHVIADVKKQSGMAIDGCVVTCPANFTDQQKQGLLNGFEKAGVKVIQLITEPAAAAYAYCVKESVGNGRISLVGCADLGHGTFDFSILKVEDGIAIPISTEGVPQLGGRNFTDIIKKILLAKMSKETGKQIVADQLPPDLAIELDEKSEKAKHALSGQPSTKVALHFGGKAQLVEITQKEFEAAFVQLIKEILACMDKAMQAGKTEYKALESFVLAGGPFNSRTLQSLVADHTHLVGKVEIDPSNVVSFGAALHALALAQKEGGFRILPDRCVLKEATGHDVGVAVIDESSGTRLFKCAAIVRKNTPVPHEHTESFRLERANQSDVSIDILQGPDGEIASKCQRIGGFFLRGIKPEDQRGERISITFKLDGNGILTVIATDRVTGTTQSVSVKLNAKSAA
jgi:molecular chaperone DnaK